MSGAHQQVSPGDPRSPRNRGQRIALGGAALLLGALLGVAAGDGLGRSGLSVPVAWAIGTTNLLFWSGIAAAGALYRSSRRLTGAPAGPLDRLIEGAMLGAIVCAALFLAVQLGRPSLAHWLVPLPNQMDTWPQLRSPLTWLWWSLGGLAVAALLSGWIGRLPDLAAARDRRAAGRGGVGRALALGWRGETGQVRLRDAAERTLAAATVVFAVATLGALAATQVTSLAAGWSVPLLVPQAAGGALLGAAAAVAVAVVLGRAALGLDARELEAATRLLVVAASVYAGAQLLELVLTATLGGEVGALASRRLALGPRTPLYFALLACAALVPQLLRLRAVRDRPVGLLATALVAGGAAAWAPGLLLVASLDRDFLPATWSPFEPTAWDAAVTLGGLALFLSLVALLAGPTPPTSRGIEPSSAADRVPAAGAAAR